MTNIEKRRSFNALRRKWQNSQVLRPRLFSIAHLLSGNSANAVIMAISTAIAARTLGPQAYGILALVLTIGRLCERLLRFESWQPLINFAAQPQVERDPARMSELMLYGLLLDIGSALLAAVLAVAAGYALAPVIHLAAKDMPLVAIYALAIAINIRECPPPHCASTGNSGRSPMSSCSPASSGSALPPRPCSLASICSRS